MRFAAALSAAVLLAVSTQLALGDEPKPSPKAEGKWVALFDGKTLKGWTPKIRHHKAGENPGKTFRVVDGYLTVAYDGYDQFDEKFGHLFYEKEFSKYRLRLEYRFIGEQVPGGPGWALRNSGIMVHGQRPETMSQDQDFPISIEVQLLGGDGIKERTTGNLCTPGTNVVMDGKLVTRHCISSRSQTYHGHQWVQAEVEVHGGEVIRHFINGKEVLSYQEPQLDLRDAKAKAIADQQGKLLTKGTISLQSESHPVQFRRIEIMELD